MEWKDKTVVISPPSHPKKLTGTRLATILGLNPWSTPFEVWLDVCNVWKKPFEDSKYTLAGKAIEPKQAEYMKRSYFMPNLVSPTEKFGEDYFKRMHGDFFHEWSVFGGMWDYLLYENGEPKAVLEMKTTKRSEDWLNNIPEYYALQAALYAYLLGVDEVLMVASFLEDSDYDDPDSFVPNASNTVVKPFKLSERYPGFESKYVKSALLWWRKHVESGISPEYDEKKDSEALTALRTAHIDVNETNVVDILKELEELKIKIAFHEDSISEKVKRFDTLKKALSAKLQGQLDETRNKAEVQGAFYKWVLSRTDSKELDIEALKQDGLYDKYCTKDKTSYRLATTKI